MIHDLMAIFKKYFVLLFTLSTIEMRHIMMAFILITESENSFYTNFVTYHTHLLCSQTTAADIVETIYKNYFHGLLPVFNKISCVMAKITTKICSVEL